MNLPRVRLLIFLFVIPGVCMSLKTASGQSQLAILRSQKVVSTIRPGTALMVKQKSRAGISSGFLVEAKEFTIITSRDTIELRDIRSISSGSRATGLSRLGKLLTVIGIGYFLSDQINNLIETRRSRFDRHVTRASASLTGAGGLLTLVRKKWDRPGRGNTRILIVDYHSKFYRE